MIIIYRLYTFLKNYQNCNSVLRQILLEINNKRIINPFLLNLAHICRSVRFRTKNTGYKHDATCIACVHRSWNTNRWIAFSVALLAWKLLRHAKLSNQSPSSKWCHQSWNLNGRPRVCGVVTYSVINIIKSVIFNVLSDENRKQL